MTVKIPDSLPWSTEVNLPYARQPRIEAAAGRNVAVVGNSHNEIQNTWESDAAYIVHTANAYPTLVEALKRIVSVLDEGILDLDDIEAEHEKARAALKAAGVEP